MGSSTPGSRVTGLWRGIWGIVDGVETPGLFRTPNLVFCFRHSLMQVVADSHFTWTDTSPSRFRVVGEFRLDWD